jgi:hypothetical protein
VASTVGFCLSGKIGFPGAYGSVKRFVRGLRGKQSPEARAVIETAPVQNSKSITALAPWFARATPASTGAGERHED